MLEMKFLQIYCLISISNVAVPELMCVISEMKCAVPELVFAVPELVEGKN